MFVCRCCQRYWMVFSISRIELLLFLQLESIYRILQTMIRYLPPLPPRFEPCALHSGAASLWISLYPPAGTLAGSAKARQAAPQLHPGMTVAHSPVCLVYLRSVVGDISLRTAIILAAKFTNLLPPVDPTTRSLVISE